MKIEFYKCVLCPRCMMVNIALKKICTAQPDLEVEHIEILTNPGRVRTAGIKSIPAIKINQDILTGLILTPAKVRDFIAQHAG